MIGSFCCHFEALILYAQFRHQMNRSSSLMLTVFHLYPKAEMETFSMALHAAHRARSIHQTAPTVPMHFILLRFALFYLVLPAPSHCTTRHVAS